MVTRRVWIRVTLAIRRRSQDDRERTRPIRHGAPSAHLTSSAAVGRRASPRNGSRQPGLTENET